MAASCGSRLAMLVLVGSLASHGCVYTGGQAETLDRPGTPIGITAVKVPFEKLVAPVPPPAGFSSTYQKQLLDRQRLARRKAERDAQAKSAAASAASTADAGK